MPAFCALRSLLPDWRELLVGLRIIPGALFLHAANAIIANSMLPMQYSRSVGPRQLQVLPTGHHERQPGRRMNNADR